MKKILILLIALLPLAVFAGGNDKKDEKIDIHINTGKDGKIVVSGLKSKDLKKLEMKINEALKDVQVNITDGNQKHTIHFKAELNID